MTAGRKPIHGEARKGSESVEYRVWAGIKTRCLNPRCPAFHRYGGRGIRVCDQWRTSFLAFLADVGRRPGSGYSLDRIDNDGNYEPGNVRWATRREQMRNTHRSRRVTVNGASLPLVDWAARAGVGVTTMRARIKAGWDPLAAVATPTYAAGTAPRHQGSVNRTKTHCPHGHAYSGKNLYVNKHGQRICRACRRDGMRRLVKERKGA